MDSAVVLPFKDYERTVFELMDRLEVAPLLAEQGLILLKPNLVTSSPPPVTTDVGMVAAVGTFLLRFVGTVESVRFQPGQYCRMRRCASRHECFHCRTPGLGPLNPL